MAFPTWLSRISVRITRPSFWIRPLLSAYFPAAASARSSPTRSGFHSPADVYVIRVGELRADAEYIDIGLKVKATPRVHENGDVSLQFEFTLSSLAGNSLNNIPVVNNQEIHQSVRVHEDESALLAGYLAPQYITTLNGTPGIANLPANGLVGGTT